jgi:hypothetical protein
MNNIDRDLNFRIGYKFENFFYVYVVASLINLYVIWVSTGYFEMDMFRNISAISSDIPGNIEVAKGLVGQHYFGDFLLPYMYAKENSFWVNEIIPLNIYPPLSMVIFKIFSFSNLSLSLYLYLALNIISILAPAADIYLKKSRKCGIQFFIITFLSAGTIATLDRGNIIGLLVAPTYYLLKTKLPWIQDTIILLISSVKIYPLLFLLINLRKKRIRTLSLLSIVCVFINLTIFELQNFSLSKNLTTFIKAYQPYNSSETYLYNSLSLKVGAENILNFFSLGKELNLIPNINLIFSLVSLILFLIFLKTCSNLQIEIKYIFAVYTMWSIVPISFVYTTILLLPIIASSAYKDSDNFIAPSQGFGKQRAIMFFLLRICLIVTLIPLPIATSVFVVKFPMMALLWFITIIAFIFSNFKGIDGQKFGHKASLN